MGTVTVEQRGTVLIGTLDNPPHALMDKGTVAGLFEIVARAESDDGVRAVVLTGSHPDRFVAHYDLGEILAAVSAAPAVGRGAASASLRAVRTMARVPGAKSVMMRSPAGGLIEADALRDLFLSMNRSAVVFVAAINGSAQGGGCELALSCDRRLMANGDYVIGQPEVLLGFPPGGGGTQRLTRLLGTGRAIDICLDGRPITAAKALEIGLVDELVDPSELLDRAVAEAARLGNRSPAAIGAVKRAIYEGGSLPLADGLHLEQTEFMAAAGTPEAKAAMEAYLAEFERTGELPAYDRDALARLDAGGSDALPGDRE